MHLIAAQMFVVIPKVCRKFDICRQVTYLVSDWIGLQCLPVVTGGMTVDVQIPVSDLSNRLFLGNLCPCNKLTFLT